MKTKTTHLLGGCSLLVGMADSAFISPMKNIVFLGILAFATFSRAESLLRPVLQSFVDKHIAPGVVTLVANKERVLCLLYTSRCV